MKQGHSIFPVQMNLATVLISLHTVASFTMHDPQIMRSQQEYMGQFELKSATSGGDITINPLVSTVKVSKTVEVFSLVKEMEQAGEAVTSLCVGEPDFPPPKVVLQAATDAISGGETRYTAVTGTADLRAAIANDLKRRKGLEYDPQTEIIVSNGVSLLLKLCDLVLSSSCLF